ncbi:S8 family serine peptidase [Actinomadura syzygii]|uniref:S8 family serine peptidase n=1 Tax=Actinomadura syzygii TaxID=1427538 RepID=A0A5D0TPL1_9ACTN|nr:S8 family serine peptidase [Actinomadura syzygii]TYC07814.1 S8 family serine peptidase [Actinomadura syzygii]
MTRWLAAIGATSALVLTTAIPADAAGPREDEWWFSAWEVQQKVWPVSKGAGVTVAVVDTGVNGRLPDLQGALVPGTDANSGSGDGQVGASSDLEDSHGTAMAALIASRGGGTGYLGVAPDAKIMSVNANLSAWDKGIRFAADHGAKVISISQGFAASNGCRPEVQKAVAYALQKDVVVVAAAGNDGNGANSPQEPANCSGVLAVGAVDSTKRAWNQTQRQPYVAVAAPGYPVNTLLANGQVTDGVAGTSQATALTSAVVALIRSKAPQMPAREVVQRIINTTKDAGPPGRDNMTGNGVIIPAAALTANVPKNAPNPVFAAYDRWLAQNPQASAKPSKTKVPKSEATKKADQADRNLYILLGIVAVVVVIGGGVLLLLVRRGRKKPPPPMGPGGGQSGPPPGWGGQAAPPQQGGQPVPPRGGPSGWGGPPNPPAGGQGGPQGGGPYPPPQGPGGSRPPN